jgi:putative metallohydrolase (TIGR04338 family)
VNTNSQFLRNYLPKRGRRIGPRDSQRSRVYAAERSLPENTMMDLGKNVSVEEMQAYVNKVCASKRLKRAVEKAGGRPTQRVTATHCQGKRGARAFGDYRIEVSGYMRNRLVILHELAHCFAPSFERHGPTFARIYLAMAQAVMGREVAGRLKAAFKAHRVRTRVKRPRKMREMTPEARAELLARLTRAREMARLNRIAAKQATT